MDNDEGESRDNGQCSRMSGSCINNVLKEMIDQTGQDDSRAMKTRKNDVFVQVESDSWQQMHDINGIVKRMEEGSKPTFFSIVNNVGQLNSALATAIRRGDWENISHTRDNENVLWQVDVDMMEEKAFALDKIKRPLYEKHPMTKFTWTLSEDTDTVEWSNIYLDALNNVEKLYQGKETADILHRKIVQLMNGKNEDMQLLLEKEFKSEKLAGVHAECLTDTWMGKDQWAFIDLSEGVRTEVSLPNVEKTIGAVAEITEDEAEDHLQEINIYELFALKHCKGRKAKLALCEELDERMRDLKNELQSFEGEEYDEAHKRKAEEASKRMENWNLFSDTYEEFHNYTVARDTFLAHLGATLWGSMRHIISVIDVPSVADGTFHYYETISFQLFFITQEKVRLIKKLPVDLKALMDGLSSLLLPAQRPMFSSHMLPLSDDPALAMAFSVARRAAAVPLLLLKNAANQRRQVKRRQLPLFLCKSDGLLPSFFSLNL
ncbi:hypothetical protein GIB67_004094 [Kingdonia uniflora]|uniref:Uncharacterized protein n=1 Tax=Kingdonia uniflora TaxID=39325 RepID=A0A7J7NRW0_9MAGN|nr:hypothetical protein GIB67_004094 [Kingdonia uniflora]